MFPLETLSTNNLYFKKQKQNEPDHNRSRVGVIQRTNKSSRLMEELPPYLVNSTGSMEFKMFLIQI